MVRQCACVAPDLMWVARLLARFRVRAPRRPSVGERPVSDAPDFVGPSQPLELGRRGRARRAVRAVAQRGAHGRQRRHARRRARGLRAAAARAAAAAEARVCAEEEARGRGNGSEARQSASACLVGAAGCPALLGQPQPGAREEGCGGGGRCLLASPPPRVRCASRTHPGWRWPPRCRSWRQPAPTRPHRPCPCRSWRLGAAWSTSRRCACLAPRDIQKELARECIS